MEEKYDYVLLLQPTSPLRRVDHIDDAIDTIVKEGSDSLVSVSEVRKSPYWMFSINDKNQLIPVLEENKSKNRQGLPKIYELNGAIYIVKREFLLKTKQFRDVNTNGFIMDTEYSVDIDDEFDFDRAERFINNYIRKK